MEKLWVGAAIMAIGAQALGSAELPSDLNLLVGKRVIVGRFALCVPNSFTTNLAYAGKTATVVAFSPNAMLARYAGRLDRLPANMRPMIEDATHGGKLTFKFDDGTVLDSCVELVGSQISPNLQLAPGETLAQTAIHQNVATRAVAPAGPQACPIVVATVSSGLSFGHALVNALTTSQVEQQVDSAVNGGVSKNYLDVRFRNDGNKDVRAFEYTAIYRNAMGDETTSPTYVSQNSQPIKPGATFKGWTMDRGERMQTGRGDVKVFVSRIRFGDDTVWTDNGSQSCSATTTSK